MLRKYVLLQQMPFDGSLKSHVLSEPVAQPLLTLIGMLLDGSSSIGDRLEADKARMDSRIRVACMIFQLICSNAKKGRSRKDNILNVYQCRQMETPFPLHVGLKLPVNDRQKGNINIFHALGMSVSYTRVMEVRKQFAVAASKRWKEDGVVVPTNIKRGIFVTGAVDNLDESGRFEFHGTAISLTSDPTSDNLGEDPPPLCLDNLGESCIQLPATFADVPYIDDYAGEITLSSNENQVFRTVINKTLKLKKLKKNGLSMFN